MRLWQNLVWLGLWKHVFSLAISSDKKVFESLQGVPDGWEVAGTPLADTKLQFRVALAPENGDLLERTLRNVSDPAHPQYGQYLSRSELKAVLTPSDAGKKAVVDWLRSSTIHDSDIQIDGEWINFVATTQQADQMMDAKFLTYRSIVEKDVAIVRTQQVFLPQNVIDYVDLVHPTTHFTPLRPRESRFQSFRIEDTDLGEVDSSCARTITPKCLRDLYNIKGVTPDPKKAGFIAVAGFLNETATQSDLTQFIEENAQWAQGAKYTFSTLNGGPTDKKQATGEATLDVQYTVPLTYPMRNHFYSTGGSGSLVFDLNFPTSASNMNEPYDEFFTYLLSLKNDADLPHTISISYGDEEQTVAATYAKKVCDMIGQLGVRGVSVISGSGDFGTGSTCQTNDGKKTTRFLPFFPASCPYVTSVGATAGINPERAVSFSSGGFSDLWLRPWYQEKAVSGYLKQLGSQWSGLYNPAGRGFPDLAAQGQAFRVITNGRTGSASGTSASTPVVAAIVALLNAQRLQEGKPTLGFLNTWLYSLDGKALTDIVDGGSRGCTGRGWRGAKTIKVPYASWNATKGWDPVTGIGTPLFDQLLKLLPANKMR